MQSRVSHQVRHDMYDLFCRQFEGVSRDQFETDFSEKNWVVLLRAAEDDRLRGFSTLHVYRRTVDEADVGVVYSGDTVVDGGPGMGSSLSRIWIGAVNALRAESGLDRLYWLLLTSGYRTYRFLPMFWREFHPRYDALTRTYTYDVGSSPKSGSPFHRRWCWALCEELEGDLLSEAATHLPGEHSFKAFSKAGQPERGDRCRISAATWSDWELGTRFTVSADRYLHHMVRYLVGTMVDVARNRRPLGDVPRLLDNDPDVTTSPPAPPEGLFLSHVEYPETVLLGSDPTTSPPRSAATA